MLEEFKGFKGFLRGVFSEADGTPSSSRIFTGIGVGFACGWVTAIVRHSFTLPDFMGLTIFISSLYGLNAGKNALSDYIQSRKQNKE